MSPKQFLPSSSNTSRKAGWSVMQRADDPDIERARHQLKEDISNGANGVALIFEGANSAYGFGYLQNLTPFLHCSIKSILMVYISGWTITHMVV